MGVRPHIELTVLAVVNAQLVAAGEDQTVSEVLKVDGGHAGTQENLTGLQILQTSRAREPGTRGEERREGREGRRGVAHRLISQALFVFRKSCGSPMKSGMAGGVGRRSDSLDLSAMTNEPNGSKAVERPSPFTGLERDEKGRREGGQANWAEEEEGVVEGAAVILLRFEKANFFLGRRRASASLNSRRSPSKRSTDRLRS